MAELIDQIVQKMGNSLANFSNQTIDALFAILVIFLFFIIGYLIAIVLAKVVEKIIKASNIEKALTGKETFIVAGFPITDIITFLLKIFVVFAFLGAAAEIVKLGFITNIILWITGYLPRLFEGIVVILGALIFSDYVGKIIRQDKEIPIANLSALVVQVFTAYIALVLALPLILPGIDVSILAQAFVWFVAACAVAIGIGFGIAMGFGLKEPIAAAAKKHSKTFDYLFEEAEKPLRRRK